MRIGIPVEAGEGGSVVEDFSAAEIFAIYEVHDETRAVGYVGRYEATAGCCGIGAGLHGQGVEVVMVHRIAQEAVNQLLEAGVLTIQDVPKLTADALIAHLVSGTLAARPPEMAMHGVGGECGASGGCGHCCGGGGHQEEGCAEEGTCAEGQCADLHVDKGGV